MKYDVVFLWKQNDSGIYGRRADMIIKELSKNNKINNIIHFDAPISVDELEKYKLKANKGNHYEMIYQNALCAFKGNKQIYGVKSYTYIYSKRISDRSDYQTMAFHFDYVKKILNENNIGKKNKVLLWGCPIIRDWEKWVKFLEPDFIVSDIIDDNREYTKFEKNKIKWTGEYEAVIDKSDLLIVNCEGMYQRIIDIDINAKKKLHIVSNGCEGYLGRIFEKPEMLKGLKSPIIGITSTLERKIDSFLLLKCVEKHPEWNFIIIGSDHTSEEALRDIKSYGNVHFCGPIPYEEAKKYISNFDIAIMPHRLISLNKPMNPLKLYVYCSLGVRVVTTNISGIEDLKDIVHTADSGSEFISMIEQVLNDRSEYNEREIEIINRHTWQKKVKLIFKHILRKNLPAKLKKERMKRNFFRLPVIRPVYLKWVKANEKIRNNKEEILFLKEMLVKSDAAYKKQINDLTNNLNDIRKQMNLPQIERAGIKDDFNGLNTRINNLSLKIEGIDNRLRSYNSEFFTEPPLVSIIIVSNNNIKSISKLLASIEKNSVYENYEIIAVKYLTDISEDLYEDIYHGNKPFKLLPCEGMSYAEALNNAAGYANGDFIVMFRNAVYVSMGWLNSLMEAQYLSDNIGASGAALVTANKVADSVYFNDEFRRIEYQNEKIYTIKPYTATGTYYELMEGSDFIERSCLIDEGILLSADRFREAKGLDICYNNGFEGMDLTLELYRRGYQNIVCPGVKIYSEKATDINNKHNFNVFQCKWQSYLERQIFTEKINNTTNLFTKSRLLVGIIGAYKDDYIPFGLSGFVARLMQEGYRVKYLSNKIEGTIDVGIDVDILIFAKAPSSGLNLLNIKGGLKKITWADTDSSIFQGDGPTIKLFKEVLLESNKHKIVKGTIDILGCMPQNKNRYSWGDYHYAQSLKNEFEKKGFKAYVKCYAEWFTASSSEYVIVLRGIFSYYPKAERQKVIIWNISHPGDVNINEYNCADLVYHASFDMPEKYAGKLNVPVKALLQCTDEKMAEVVENGKKDDLIFVGNKRPFREVVKYAASMKWNLSVYGNYWEGYIPQKYIKGVYLDNDILGQAYRNAKIVLNDHAEDMRIHGFVNNRIYDALAARSFIISDYMPEISDLFGDCVETFSSKNELEHKIDYYLRHPELMEEKAKRGQEIVLREHTFSKRVETMISDMEMIAEQIYE